MAGSEYDGLVDKRRIGLRLFSLNFVSLVSAVWFCGLAVVVGTGCRERAAPPVASDLGAASPTTPPPVNPPPLPALRVPQGPDWDELKRLVEEQKLGEAAVLAERLREQAQGKQQQDEWAQALVREVQLRAGRQEIETAVRLLRSQKWPDAPLPRLLVELYYAHSLLEYLQRYSYEIRQRERIATTAGSSKAPAEIDLKAWSYEQIIAEAQRALAHLWQQREALGGTPIAALAPFVQSNNYPAEVRGTLRDALTYLLVGLLVDTAHWRPEQNDLYRFDIAALLRGDPLQAQAASLDDQAVHPLLRAMLALDDLESWHRRSGRHAAALEARLSRYAHLRQLLDASFISERTAIRKDLAVRLADPALQQVPWRAMGLAALARMMREDLADSDGPMRAYELAVQGQNAFPGTPGAAACQSLAAELTTPHFALASMLVDAVDKPSLQVTHRNLSVLHLRAYAVDFAQLLALADTDALLPDSELVHRLVYGDETKKLPPAKPAAVWSVTLAKTPDLKDHVTFVSPPLSQRGLYVIAASSRPDFAASANQVVAVTLQRSDLALVSHTGSDGSAEVTVVEAATGQPASGARVDLYRAEWEHRPQRLESRVVDATGSVRFPARRGAGDFTLVAERGGDRVIDAGSLSLFFPGDSQVESNELIYIDRAIYRPQQKLYFKILAYAGRAEEGRFRLRPRQRVVVRLRDANYQEVARREVTTNGFGTAAGEFVLPAGRLLGSWTIQTRGGQTAFRVEEYKRPSFEVTLRESKDPLLLNRPAVLPGEARYYFGQPVGEGTVKYRVTRQAVAPRWFSQWQAWALGRSARGRVFGERLGLNLDGQVTVASGEAALRPDGTFDIQFTPQADARRGRDFTYSYTLTTELTDEGGETRSATRTFRLGFVAIEATLSSDFGYLPSGTPSALKALRRSLDGTGRAGAGSYKLLRLKPPARAALPAELPMPEPPPIAEKTIVAAAAVELPGDRQRPRFDTAYDPQDVLAKWPDGDQLAAGALTHDAAGEAAVPLPALLPGAYRVRYETKDEFGAAFATSREFVVGNAAGAGPTALALLLEPAEPTVKVGGVARLLLHSALPAQPIYLDVYRDGVLKSRRIIGGSGPASAAHIVELPIGDGDRGGLTVQAWIVRDYQRIELRRDISVPWNNMELALSFATFRDTLRPGAKETFRISVTAPDGQKLAAGAAEVLALMHDRSLDLFAPFHPPSPLDLFPTHMTGADGESSCRSSEAVSLVDEPLTEPPKAVELHGDMLNFGGQDADLGLVGYGMGGGGTGEGTIGLGTLGTIGRGAARKASRLAQPPGEPEPDQSRAGGASLPKAQEKDKAKADVASRSTERRRGPTAADSAGAPADAAPRQNFAETAFFFPQLLIDGEGGVSFEFTVPESATGWRVWAQAISRSLQSGTVEGRTRTVKELLVRPYLPRFFREGDEADLRVVVNNSSAEALAGTLELAILDAESQKPRSDLFALQQPSRSFRVEPGQSTTLAFAVRAPKQVGLYAFQVTARAGDRTDGELRPLPVLPSRMHLSQSQFVSLRDAQARRLHFADLKLNDDPSRRNEQLVVTLDAQLFYTALKALPYLVSYPYECTEQTLNRFVSTGILSSLFQKYPQVAQAAEALARRRDGRSGKGSELDAWDAADPNRKLALEEAPWLAEARGGQSAEETDGDAVLLRVLHPEVARRQRDSALAKLRKAQLPSGGYPWFAGGPASADMTLYLVQGFARAAEFQVPIDRSSSLRAWQYLAGHFRREYQKQLTAAKADPYFLTTLNYAASSFPDASFVGGALTPEERSAILDYTFARWRELPLYLRTQLALTLRRSGRPRDAQLVFASVLDAAKTSTDQGTYFAPEERSWLWYNDTIESHAFILRALTELAPQSDKKDGLVLWLLLNKKLNQWKSTRATAEVLYALAHVLKQEGSLGIKEEVLVKTGGRSGPIEQRYTFLPQKYVGKVQLVVPESLIDPTATSTITVEKQTRGLLFASATWHFSTDRLPTQGVGGLFQVERRYFRRTHNGKEYILTPLGEGTELAVGDELEVQLSLRSKHAAEYVHLRDPRAAGLEPENAVSRYRWDLGAAAYEEVRDSSANYFFERLPAGEYTFIYRLRASMAGTFRIGPTTLQSMYAPEFTAYSAGHKLNIRASGQTEP